MPNRRGLNNRQNRRREPAAPSIPTWAGVSREQQACPVSEVGAVTAGQESRRRAEPSGVEQPVEPAELSSGLEFAFRGSDHSVWGTDCSHGRCDFRSLGATVLRTASHRGLVCGFAGGGFGCLRVGGLVVQPLVRQPCASPSAACPGVHSADDRDLTRVTTGSSRPTILASRRNGFNCDDTERGAPPAPPRKSGCQRTPVEHLESGLARALSFQEHGRVKLAQRSHVIFERRNMSRVSSSPQSFAQAWLICESPQRRG